MAVARREGLSLREPEWETGRARACTLEPGANASLQWKGEGANVPGLALPFTLPVTVQLVTSDGSVCSESVYALGSRASGTATAFKGRQD